MEDFAEVKADWSINPILYNGTSWPNLEFMDAPEFGTRAARFESDALSLGTIRDVTGHGPTIMNWQKYMNQNTRWASSGTVTGNVPLNDLYARYCVMIEKDIVTGMNEGGVKLGGLISDTSAIYAGGVFWHGRPDAQGRIPLNTYWYGEGISTSGWKGGWAGFMIDASMGAYLLIDKWHCLEQHLKLNSMNPDGTANADAEVEAWLDDRLIFSRKNFVIHRYTGPKPIEINIFWGQIYHGGNSVPFTPIHYRVTGFALSHKRIGAPKRLQ